MTDAPAPVAPPSSREPVVRPACATGAPPSAELNRPQAPLVEPRSDALVVNIGDIVQVWSNGRYRAPLHRVLSPVGTGIDTARRSLSIPATTRSIGLWSAAAA